MLSEVADQRFVFKFYYIGIKKYYGSQRQNELLTIEEILINLLQERGYIQDIKSSNFEVASRTDRFVSARGSAFSITTNKNPILMEINSGLPKEIGVWSISEVPLDFSPRFNAILRHYKYIVSQPLTYLKRNHTVNLELMERACKQIEGNHDFKNFSKKNKDEKNTIRDIDQANFIIENNYLIFNFKSQAFLRQQIRRMVKIILDLGLGVIKYEDFLDLFDRSKEYSFQPAPPEGLILWDIHFDEKIKFEVDNKSYERMERKFLHQELKYGLRNQLFRILQ